MVAREDGVEIPMMVRSFWSLGGMALGSWVSLVEKWCWLCRRWRDGDRGRRGLEPFVRWGSMRCCCGFPFAVGGMGLRDGDGRTKGLVGTLRAPSPRSRSGSVADMVE